MTESLIAVLVWHLARAYVLGSIDPHERLLAWLREPGAVWPALHGLRGALLAASSTFVLWVFWPLVAWRYCKDNPQEKVERSFALWGKP